MTATAIETSVLESLDFEIVCQATIHNVLMQGKPQIGDCNVTATHTATIHSAVSCAWIEKFLCAHHAMSYRDSCWDCGIAPRIKDCKHLRSTQ